MARIRANVPCMTSTTQRIAAKVRGVSAERRLTQQGIADALELSRTSVVERINGRVPFTATEILILARTLNVQVGRFFPTVEEMLLDEPEMAVAS